VPACARVAAHRGTRGELAAGTDEDSRAVQREPAAWTIAMERCQGHLHR